MSFNVLSIPSASSSENLQALEEVSDFGTTNMGVHGQGPWTYRILQEPAVTAELDRLSNGQTTGNTDSVSFQPCPPYVSQNMDRYTTQFWDLPGGQWQFNGVFDGHLNHHTVDFVVQSLPTSIKQSLHSALAGNSQIHPGQVTKLLHDSVIRLDKLICSQFVDLFPQDLNHLTRMTDAQIKYILQNGSAERSAYTSAARCLGGTTVLVSLTDPLKRNLWVANLGDCHAVLGRQNQGTWSGSLINAIHNTQSPSEARRVRAEHPRENHSIQHDRVLGFLEPTRAIGDIWLKIPSVYTSCVLSKLDQEWISPARLGEYSRRILTPPYVSNIPDVYHREVPNSPSFLILCSDGLTSADVYQGLPQTEMIHRWVNVVGQTWGRSRGKPNMGLYLLRDAIGGQDAHRLSRNMTVEMEERWMDDVTIVIQRFG